MGSKTSRDGGYTIYAYVHAHSASWPFPANFQHLVKIHFGWPSLLYIFNGTAIFNIIKLKLIDLEVAFFKKLNASVNARNAFSMHDK